MSIRSDNKIKIEGGMSSMTDLVFLLLIFFIILSALAKSPTDVDLPQGGVATTDVSKTKVMIDKDNKIRVNGTFTDLKGLEDLILEKMGDDTVLELYADKKAKVKAPNKVIEIAKNNGLKIYLMTQ